MPTIFSKGNFYLGYDEKDEYKVSNVTKKPSQIHICVHMWNIRLEYDYMQPSKRYEKHYDSNSITSDGNGPSQTLRSSDGQNLKSGRSNKRTRSKFKEP